MQSPKLEDIAALAIAAGREIMAVRAAGFEALKKGDGSVVTEADHRAEAVIEAGLQRLAPDVPMIGEEAFEAGRTPEFGAAFFCVDPLDGTRGFAQGGDEFTVNIALVRNRTPEMGVIYEPVSGVLYAGAPGRALRARIAFESDAPVVYDPIAVRAQQGPTWRIVASRTFGRTEKARAFAAALGAVSQDDASSSIKFCRVAEGAADLYPRFGDMREWDAAAGHAILRAAGGDVMRLDGAPLLYGRREDGFMVRGLIAYADADAAAAARAAINAIGA